MKRLLLAALLAPALSAAVPAAAFDPMQAGRQPIRVYGDREGLPQNTLHAIAFDRKGVLWAGTQDGLARYNGSRWRVFDLPGRAISNYVRALLPASDGSLWVGRQDGGLSRFRDGRWTTYDTTNGFPADRVNALLETTLPDGVPRLWAATHGGGIARLEGEVWSALGTAEGLPDARVWTLAEASAPSGRPTVWAGTERGLAYLEGGRFVPFDASGKMPEASYGALLESHGRDGKRTLWAGSWGRGLVKVEGEAVTVLDAAAGFPSNLVTSLLETDGADGPALWVGTSGAGLVVLEGGRTRVLDTATGLPSRQVYALASPRTGPAAGAVWIATGGGGLAALRPGKWVSFDVRNGLPSNQVFATVEAALPDGSPAYWFATNGGVARLSRRGLEVFARPEGLPASPVTALARVEEPAGGTALWAGTPAEGIFRFDGSRFEPLPAALAPPSLRVNRIVAVRDDSGRSEVLVATDDRGIARLSGGRWALLSRSDGLPSDSALSVLPLRSAGGAEELWIGTRKGLARVSGRRVALLGRADGLPNEEVRDLALVTDSSGRRHVWAGTMAGAVRIDPDASPPALLVLDRRSRPALPDDSVPQVGADRSGRVYLGTHRGILRLTSHEPTPDDPSLFQAVPYTVDDGLPSDVASYAKSLLDGSGRVWMATTSGVAVLDPSEDVIVEGKKPLFVERATVGGVVRTAGADGIGDVAHDENRVVFELALLSYTHERDVRFRSQLLGYEKEPGEWTSEPVREFTGLPPGRYVFRAWGRDGFGRDTAPLSVPFTVRPAPWRAWWALTLYAGVVAVGVGLGVRFRLDRLRRQNELLEAKVAQRTAALYASEQRALAASRAKTAFLANVSHELRTPLNAVIGYAEMLAEDAAERGNRDLLPDLERIRTAAQHLLGLIDDVLDLAKIEAGKMSYDLSDVDVATLVATVEATARPIVEKNQNGFEVRLDPDLGSVRTDAVKLRQSLLNLLGNAGKFTRGGHVRLEVRRRAREGADGVSFVVADTGIGIPPERRDRIFEPFVQAESSTNRRFGGTGLGLSITKRFCQMMGGDVTVESEVGKGTAFEIWLPLEAPAPPPSSASLPAIRLSGRFPAEGGRR